METIFVRRWFASFAGVPVILLLLTPAVGADQFNQAKPIEITYTKWVRVVGSITLLEGFTGGDVVGTFAGEVLETKLSFDGAIRRIEAVYEVQAGDQSFTALIHGGRTTNPGDAILDGVILAGWRTGAEVHVEFKVIPAPSPLDAACYGAPAGLTCFQGTISVGRVPGN
jgi:hypothetical protein